MNNARVKDPKKKQGTKTEKWKNGNKQKKKIQTIFKDCQKRMKASLGMSK